MGKIVAIISEYNPFHKGHAYQIDCIRRDFGEDTAIIAIMSGNYTQRADVAFADKLLRATAAVESGVNLVLELPFPYSCSSAEFFARSGVAIANSLGVVDYISFGSELGDIEALQTIARNMMSQEFKSALANAQKNAEYVSLGHPALIEKIYCSLYGDIDQRITSPNNTLALEYLKAITESNSSLKPHTVKRVGADYNELALEKNELPSASAIRESYMHGDCSAFEYITNSAKSIFCDAHKTEQIPCNFDKLSTAIISHFRLNPTPVKNIHDAGGGLYNRLARLSLETDSITSLTALAQTKKYTTARIRRATLFSFLGVTSSDIKTLPRYTQVLAMDTIGSKVLKSIKKSSTLTIITKPSTTKGLDDIALQQKKLSDAADSIFQLSKPRTTHGAYHLTFTPYVKK